VTFGLANEVRTAPQHLDSGSAAFVDLILWQCGARTLSQSALEQLYELGATLSLDDWQILRERAHAEGMEALLLAHATEAGLLSIMPAQVADSLMAAYRTNWIWNRRLRGEQRRIVDAIRAHGIDVVVVKGVALAERYYGEIALRPIGDIDVLVRPEDAEDCGRILSMSGYAPLPGREKPSQWHALVNRALAFRSDAGFTIDVHWALASLPPYVASFPQAEIWRCAEDILPVGQAARRLSTADELRFLSYHYAAQHVDRRLIWLVDIAEVVRTLPPGWNWQQFTSDTIIRGQAMPVAVALGTAERVLALKVPSKVLLDLNVAAAHPQERMAWRAAQAHRNGLRAMYEHMKVQDGIGGRLAFGWQGLLWHAVLPARNRVTTLRQKLPVR
jgi:Uncharacterised nucleotidyltransferase